VTRRPFNADDETLLREVVTKHRPDLLPLFEDAAAGRVLSALEANELQDAIGDEMGMTPLDEADGLTEAGVRLDALIDCIARASEIHKR
jgi:hypothetical protein